MQFDLSPLRPWEYWQTDAFEWTQALDLRRAFRDGLELADTEHKVAESAKAAAAGKR